MSPKLSVRAVGKHFDRSGVPALADLSFNVASGEFVALVGASGCGKSTLLRIIAGLETASSGEILVDERPISGPDGNRAMVFQDYSLYPWLSVLDNIRFSLRLRENEGEPAGRGAERAQLLLELMGLQGVRDVHPQALSGGMRQRVAIARALLSRPDLLLMDEPFGALDAQTRGVMHDLILHVLAVERSTILFVTHDVEEALYLADRVIVLAPTPGRIDSVWCPDLPPALQRTQQLKRSPEFLTLEEQILERIRATSTLQSDLGALHRFTAHAAAGE
jgi:NitT/TauT family transport system ATP-binding protein